MAEVPENFKVFVSYSRDDMLFTEQLVLALKDRGFDPLIDRHSIDVAEEWKKRLGELIFRCDTLVFVLSVHSATSPLCAWEVNEAARLGKRMIPVLPASMEGVKPPPQLSKLNYLFFYAEPTIPGSGFYDGIIRLDRALRVNLAWLREATRLSEAAADWIASDRNIDMCLRGTALEDAESWRMRAPDDTEIPSQTLTFIAASAEAETRRKIEAEAQLAERQRALSEREEAVLAQRTAVAEKIEAEKALRDTEIAAARDRERAAKRVAARTRTGAIAALVLAIAAGFFGIYARFQAAETRLQKQRAVREQTKAEEALARLLVDRSWNLSAGERELSMKYALAGYQFSQRSWPLVRASLARSINEGLQTAEVFRASSQVISLVLSPDNLAYIALTRDMSAELWLFSSEKQFWERTMIFNGVRAATFSPDASLLVIASRDRTVLLVDTATGQTLKRFIGHTDTISSAAFSPDGKRLVTASFDKTAILWEPFNGKTLAHLKHSSRVWLAFFSPDGTRLLTISGDGSASLWDAGNGTAIGQPMKHNDRINTATFSADGTRVMTASQDNTTRLWDTVDGSPIGKLMKHDAAVIFAIFSADGTRVMTASLDYTTRLWDAVDGSSLCLPMKHKGPVTAGRFSVDKTRLLTLDSRGNYYIWSSNNSDLERVFLSNRYGIDHGIFSDDGNFIGVDTSGKIIIWEMESGRVILETKSADQKLKLLNVAGSKVLIGRSDGSVHILNYSVALKSIEELKMEVCRHLEATNNTNFNPLEVAADALIADTWISQERGRSLCDLQ